MADMPNETWKAVGARVRAARIAAGYKNRVELAADITLPRFGKDTIGDVERGSRELFEHEALELGRVLRRPSEWFYAEPDGGESQLDRIQRRLERLEIAVQDQNDLLARQSRLLAKIEALVAGVPTPAELAEEAEAIAQAHVEARERSAKPKRATR